jgi:ribose transport system ATP-binding protein
LSRLVARGIGKTFGGTRALDAVDFAVQPGTIHALLGENGAGKSTLMKIVAGALRPDTGTLELDGVRYTPADPLAARRLGVSIVYQELSVCPHMTVAENVVLGMEPRRFGFVVGRAEAERVRRALAPLAGARGALAPTARLSELSAAERQLVEIARALAADGTRLLILDEPTSSLSHDDVERLFEVLRGLRQRGIAVLYISHFLEEVRRIADDYTVLRDGRTVSSGRVAETTNDAFVAAMAGHSVVHRERRARIPGAVVLSVSGLSGERLPETASFELRRGEVLGIAGLVGSGRTELLRAVFGLDAVRRGEVTVLDAVGAASPARRLEQGVGLLSEDRKAEGLLLELSIAENITLSKLKPLRRAGLLSRRAEREVTERWTKRLGIRHQSAEQRVSELSGGNQQKVAFARLLYHDVDVLLLDEPTRGIDVRSRAEIHALIDDLCERGKAVLVVSSQLSELLSLCDRIAVMHRGILGPARPARELSEHALLMEATGA